MKRLNLTHERLLEILFKAWSEKSSTKYSPDNPALGQCGVTALVVNDLLGGEILKTPLSEGWHFYNRINGQVYDFTASHSVKRFSIRKFFLTEMRPLLTQMNNNTITSNRQLFSTRNEMTLDTSFPTYAWQAWTYSRSQSHSKSFAFNRYIPNSSFDHGIRPVAPVFISLINTASFPALVLVFVVFSRPLEKSASDIFSDSLEIP
jgi:hypothetical protein